MSGARPSDVEGGDPGADPVDGDEPAAGSERAASEALVRRIATLAEEKAATDLTVLDVGELVGYTDFLIICAVRNERQAKAVHDGVYETLKKEDDLLPAAVEGAREARWILMDYLDCVLHVLVPEMRDRYRLDQLWGEAPRLELPSAQPPTA
ncbi:MAG: ribosome silencing factor [Solirubrobacterales bacterium]